MSLKRPSCLSFSSAIRHFISRRSVKPTPLEFHELTPSLISTPKCVAVIAAVSVTILAPRTVTFPNSNCVSPDSPHTLHRIPSECLLLSPSNFPGASTLYRLAKPRLGRSDQGGKFQFLSKGKRPLRNRLQLRPFLTIARSPSTKRLELEPPLKARIPRSRAIRL